MFDWLVRILDGDERLLERDRKATLHRAIRAVRITGKEQTMEATLRCKMQVEEVLFSKNSDGTVAQERVKLRAVYGGPTGSPENAQWSKWTPAASFEIHINNPDAMGKLSAGHEYFVDFTPAK